MPCTPTFTIISIIFPKLRGVLLRDAGMVGVQQAYPTLVGKTPSASQAFEHSFAPAPVLPLCILHRVLDDFGIKAEMRQVYVQHLPP